MGNIDNLQFTVYYPMMSCLLYIVRGYIILSHGLGQVHLGPFLSCWSLCVHLAQSVEHGGPFPRHMARQSVQKTEIGENTAMSANSHK